MHGHGDTTWRQLDLLEREVVACRACPRLVQWREQVARERRAAYASENYWGRPVPGWGDAAARIMVVGLAPGAHGANRTGRMFTGDRSGDWLYRAMHRTGLASQPGSTGRGDGLELRGSWVTAAVRCAPPANRPTTEERDTCLPFLTRELRLLAPTLRVVVCLGRFALDGFLRAAAEEGLVIPRPRPRFGHGAETQVGPLAVVCSFHPSQQNTFTGRLTEQMLDEVFRRARTRAGLEAVEEGG